ncbi:MAG TPA: DUF3291 domain-containing protein [Euzebyales bacterium]|nr:DUF3291 domain-containing protein [Euzebyales bacterium]
MTQRGPDRPAGPPAVGPDIAQLAQINIGRLRYPVDAPQLREFSAALAHINALAERADGFVWRHPTDFGHLSGAELLGDPATVINLSVWRTYEHLHAFTYRSAHGAFVRRRSRWFTQLPQPTTALWWVPAGTRPTPAEAVARLRMLRRYGPTPQAFTVRRRFTPQGRPAPKRGGTSIRPAGDGQPESQRDHGAPADGAESFETAR